MKNSRMRSQESAKVSVSKNPDQTVEVLYQKMGDRWFAFSLIDDEIFVGSISSSEIDGSAHSARLEKGVGHS